MFIICYFQILSMLVFSISFSAYYSGAGMVEFAGFWTFVEVTIWFILHSVDIIPRIAWNYMMVSDAETLSWIKTW